MDSDNVSQLVVPRTPSHEQRSHVEAPERDAEFLSLKFLNKHGRVRLSPAGINYNRLPGKLSLLAVGNKKRCFAAAVCQKESSNHVLVSTLRDLHTAFQSGQPDPEPFIHFTPRQPLLSVPGIPVILKFALNDERFLVGFLEGPILVYSTDDLFAPTRDSQPNPIYAFPGDSTAIPRDISPNPGESPQLVAILRGVHGREPGHQVDIIDVRSLKHIGGWRKGSDPDAAPVSISWSPRGKQIAIGLQSGDMILYSPLSTTNPKAQILKPPSIPAGASSLLATTWLSNPTFHTVYSTPEASSSLFDPTTAGIPSSTHYISSHDSRSRSAIDVELLDPCPPFGALRPPGPLSVVLRNWSPAKFIIFCGDGPSADIGVIGTLPVPSNPNEDMWVNFSLEETSTPSLPLGEDSMETVLLGLEIDLTSSKSIRMSEQPDDGTPDLPPSPILYAYVSDGTIVAWHILNSKSETYPGMMAGGEDAVPTPSSVPQRMESVQVFGMPSPRVSPPVSPGQLSLSSPAQASNASALTAPVFGQSDSTRPTSMAASTPTFNGFGSPNMTSKFGSTGFGFGASPAPSAAPAFGSTGFTRDVIPSPRAHNPASSPASGPTSLVQTGPTFGAPGFGAKAAAPAFGQSGFSATSAMSGATKSPSSLGSSSGGFASFAKQGTSAFGAPVNNDSSVSESKTGPASVIGQGAFGRPSSASAPQSSFGALLNPSASSEVKHTPTPAFGQSPFGPPHSAPLSAFAAEGPSQANSTRLSVFGTGGVGQTSMATTPAFGQQQTSKPMTAFGSFGQKAASPAPGSRGFGSATVATTLQSGGFGRRGAPGEALNRGPSLVPAKFDSPPGSPTSPAGSPPHSPESHSRSLPMKPASSYVKPAEGFGAFLRPATGLGTSAATAERASFIKPAEGFKPASQDKSSKPASAHQKPSAPILESTGLGSSATPAANPAVPTFGSTSALGRSTPVFGTSTFGRAPQPAVTEPSKPITGGFGAFSSGGGGFASFVKAEKPTSFADILTSSEPEEPKPDATPLAFGEGSVPKPPGRPTFGVPNERKASLIPPAEKLGDSLQVHTGTVGKADLNKKYEVEDPPLGLLSLGEERSEISSPPAPQTPTTSFQRANNFERVSDHASDRNKDPEEGEVRSGSDRDRDPEEGDETHSKPDRGRDPEETHETPSKPDRDRSPEEGDGTSSEPFSITDDGNDRSATEEAEHQPRSPTPSFSDSEAAASVDIPLPDTLQDKTPRSTPNPTPTPTPTSAPVVLPHEAKMPEVKLSSPSPEPSPSSSTIDEGQASTTPSGSPEKPISTIQPVLPAPVATKPALPTSTSSPFGLGLGRPSSRPIRSSPLASAPITNADHEDSAPDVTPSRSPPVIAKAESVEAKTPSRQWSPPVSVPITAPPTDSGNISSTSKSRRPGTPPLLGAATPTSNVKLVPLGSLTAPGPPQAPATLNIPRPPTQAPFTTPFFGASSEEEEKIPEHPMQVEFLRAYKEMTNELVQLYKKAQEMALIRPIISEPRGLDKFVLLNNQEFAPGKYSHGDLMAFATMLGALWNRMIPLLEQSDANKHLLLDLQNLALMSETKQEELSRWVRARMDPDFDKTLKPRALGPEHSENQTRLRKAIQTYRDHIQQCEDEVESLKRRLEKHKTGKVGLRPPSLDTIDRTCRNIQLALEERTEALEQLRKRIETLSPRDSHRLQSPNRHLGSPVSSRGVVTPPFASVAAAALNSERSSLRLKDVLLSTRRDPLLTTRIAKLEVPNSTGPETQRPEWKLPPVPPLGMSSARRVGRWEKRHGAVRLKASTPGANNKPVPFDWGPLPGTAPMDKLSFDLRSHKGKGNSGCVKPDVGDDKEWDQEAGEDYKTN